MGETIDRLMDGWMEGRKEVRMDRQTEERAHSEMLSLLIESLNLCLTQKAESFQIFRKGALEAPPPLLGAAAHLHLKGQTQKR